MTVLLADFPRQSVGYCASAGSGAAIGSAVWAAKGNWDQAHKIVQDESDKASAWVHAYLHRVEGDLGNAGYWYRQAGQPAAKDSLEAEWERDRVRAARGVEKYERVGSSRQSWSRGKQATGKS